MSDFVQNHWVALAVIAPCAAALILLECLYSVPADVPRLHGARVVFWTVSTLLLAVFTFVVVARFILLKK